jgi:hypothetical protein
MIIVFKEDKLNIVIKQTSIWCIESYRRLPQVLCQWLNSRGSMPFEQTKGIGED